jgi:hypothetical protein
MFGFWLPRSIDRFTRPALDVVAGQFANVAIDASTLIPTLPKSKAQPSALLGAEG